MYIYSTTHIKSGRIYVGMSSRDFSPLRYPGSGIFIRRLCAHHGCTATALLKLGYCVKNQLEYVEGKDRNLLAEREIYWIAKVRKEFGDLCMNFTEGGNGSSGPVHGTNSSEHNRAIAEGLKKRKTFLTGHIS